MLTVYTIYNGLSLNGDVHGRNRETSCDLYTPYIVFQI